MSDNFTIIPLTTKEFKILTHDGKGDNFKICSDNIETFFEYVSKTKYFNKAGMMFSCINQATNDSEEKAKWFKKMEKLIKDVHKDPIIPIFTRLLWGLTFSNSEKNKGWNKHTVSYKWFVKSKRILRRGL